MNVSFILAVTAVVGTFICAAMVGFANGMSDAPTEKGMRIWPIFLVGFSVAGLLAGSHYLHASW